MSAEDEIVLCECGNCTWRGDVSECNEIHRLLDRVETGDEFPAGECPKCGALTYLVRKTESAPAQVTVSVSGGVAEVIGKPVGVTLTIFDYDVDAQDQECLDHDLDGTPCVINHFPADKAISAH